MTEMFTPPPGAPHTTYVPAYRCTVALHEGGKQYVMRAETRRSRRFAARWLAHEALHLARLVDPQPSECPWTELAAVVWASADNVPMVGPRAVRRLYDYALSLPLREVTVRDLAVCQRYSLVVEDVGVCFELSAQAVLVASSSPGPRDRETE